MGLGAGFGGLMLLVAPSIGNGTLSPIGISALIVSSISWAIGSLYSSKAKLPISVLASSGMLMITGGLMLTSVSFLLGEYQGLDLSQISGQSLGCTNLFDNNYYCSWIHRLLLAPKSYNTFSSQYICICKSRNSGSPGMGNPQGVYYDDNHSCDGCDSIRSCTDGYDSQKI